MYSFIIVIFYVSLYHVYFLLNQENVLKNQKKIGKRWFLADFHNKQPIQFFYIVS